MAAIPNESVPMLYEVSRRVYENELTFTAGQNLIVEGSGININSVAGYINNFRLLVEGERFARAMNAFSMEYFLTQIFYDYGSSVFEKAISAYKKHIEYYESTHGGRRMHGMRRLYDQMQTKFCPQQFSDEIEQAEIIDEIERTKVSRSQLLEELKNLKPTDPEIIYINGKAYRRENKIIAQIKILRGFACQFCGTYIPKKDGGKYIEAAHIKAKHLKGHESLYNIILLCPNHHKEFDFGYLQIVSHTDSYFEVLLNGNRYRANFE